MDDDDGYKGKYLLLFLPLILLFFQNKFGTITYDKVIVWIFLIYAFMLLIYMANNEGKAQSPQVVGDNFHFSTACRNAVNIGDYVVLWDGIDWAFRLDFKSRVIVAHKDAVEKIGDNYLVRALCYKRRFYELPDDVQKVFRTYNLKRDKILYGSVTKAVLSKNPSLLFYEDTIARLSDENSANRNYAQAKMTDLDELMVKISQWSNAGAKKSVLQGLIDSVNKPTNKDEKE